MNAIRVERLDGVGLITIDRPERRNALSLTMLAEMADAAEHLAAGCSAVVLAGAGGLFSAGVDLEELGRGVEDVEVDQALERAVSRLSRLPVPTVAAIEGACVGGAVEVALALDARVMARGAFFSVPAVSLGILYRPAALARLSARLGPSAAARLMLFADRLGPETSAALGLVTDLCDEGEARERALTLARSVPNLTGEAVKATKRVLLEVAEGRGEEVEWERVRHALLVSEERAAALARARRPRGER